MKRCKHVLSLLLAVLMVLSTGIAYIPTAFAEGTNEAKIGTTEYATLAAAITAAKDGDTITLLTDVDVNANDNAIKKTITIDGGEAKYKITNSKNGYLFHFYQSFTLKNLTFDTSHGFRFYNTAEKEAVGTLENVNWTLGAGLLVNIQGGVAGVTQTLNIKNSTITKKAVAGDPMIATYSHSGWAKPGICDVTINIDNSTLNQNGGATNGHVGNTSMFYFCCAKTVALNLQNNTVLNYNPLGNANSVQSAIVYEIPTTVNTDATAKINLIGSGAATANNYFAYKNNATYGTLTMNDSGASWIVSEAIAKRGFYAPYAGSFDVNGTEKAFITGNPLCTGTTALTYKKASATYSLSDLTTDTSKSASGFIFKIGDKAYSKWADALAVGGEIKLIGHTPMITSKIALTKDVVIDGQNLYTLTANTYFFALGGKNVTFKNLTINTTNGVRTDSVAGSNVIFDNCKVTVTGGLLVNFNKNSNVTFKNTTVTSSAADPVILIQEGATSNINLENSTITYTKGSPDNDNNTSIINIAGKANGTVTIDGKSKLIYNPNNTRTNNQVISIHDDGTSATVNLKSGAVLEYNTVPSDVTSLTFLRVTKATLNLVDEGATWTVSEAVAKKGLRYVNVTTAGTTLNTDIVALKTADGKLYSLTEVVNLSAKTSMTAVNMGLANVAGASIRVSEPTGIRFETEIDKDFYTTLGLSAVYGVKVALKDTLASTAFSALTDDNSVSVMTSDEGFKWVTEGEKFRTVLLDIDSANYATKLAWNAFVTVTYEDGKTATFWADYSEVDNSRSLADVANSALADTTATWTADEQAILNAIAGK